ARCGTCRRRPDRDWGARPMPRCHGTHANAASLQPLRPACGSGRLSPCGGLPLGHHHFFRLAMPALQWASTPCVRHDVVADGDSVPVRVAAPVVVLMRMYPAPPPPPPATLFASPAAPSLPAAVAPAEPLPPAP